MIDRENAIRGFRTTFWAIGAAYILMAVSMLLRGPEVLLDFGVSPQLVAAPVLADFFSFFYQLMAFVGVLKIVFGYAVRERRTQMATAATFCVANVLFTLRDLSTSDSPFGNALYEGHDTLVFVAINAMVALAFATLVVKGVRQGRQTCSTSASNSSRMSSAA